MSERRKQVRIGLIEIQSSLMRAHGRVFSKTEMNINRKESNVTRKIPKGTDGESDLEV